INADGLDDVVVLTGGGGIQECLNNGDGTSFQCRGTAFSGYERIAIGELTGNPGPQLVAAGNTKLHVFQSTPAGLSMLADVSTIRTTQIGNDSTVALVTGKFDGGPG